MATIAATFVSILFRLHVVSHIIMTGKVTCKSSKQHSARLDKLCCWGVLMNMRASSNSTVHLLPHSLLLVVVTLASSCWHMLMVLYLTFTNTCWHKFLDMVIIFISNWWHTLLDMG